MYCSTMMTVFTVEAVTTRLVDEGRYLSLPANEIVILAFPSPVAVIVPTPSTVATSVSLLT